MGSDQEYFIIYPGQQIEQFLIFQDCRHIVQRLFLITDMLDHYQFQIPVIIPFFECKCRIHFLQSFYNAFRIDFPERNSQNKMMILLFFIVKDMGSSPPFPYNFLTLVTILKIILGKEIDILIDIIQSLQDREVVRRYSEHPVTFVSQNLQQKLIRSYFIQIFGSFRILSEPTNNQHLFFVPELFFFHFITFPFGHFGSMNKLQTRFKSGFLNGCKFLWQKQYHPLFFFFLDFISCFFFPATTSQYFFIELPIAVRL